MISHKKNIIKFIGYDINHKKYFEVLNKQANQSLTYLNAGTAVQLFNLVLIIITSSILQIFNVKKTIFVLPLKIEYKLLTLSKLIRFLGNIVVGIEFIHRQRKVTIQRPNENFFDALFIFKYPDIEKISHFYKVPKEKVFPVGSLILPDLKNQAKLFTVCKNDTIGLVMQPFAISIQNDILMSVLAAAHKHDLKVAIKLHPRQNQADFEREMQAIKNFDNVRFVESVDEFLESSRMLFTVSSTFYFNALPYDNTIIHLQHDAVDLVETTDKENVVHYRDHARINDIIEAHTTEIYGTFSDIKLASRVASIEGVASFTGVDVIENIYAACKELGEY